MVAQALVHRDSWRRASAGFARPRAAVGGEASLFSQPQRRLRSEPLQQHAQDVLVFSTDL